MSGTVLATELLKLKRSWAPVLSLAALMLGPLAIALFMWIVQEPDRAARLGLLGTKANLAGIEATWPAYASFLVMIVGAAGMIVLAFEMAYLFGREYSEGTAKNMLALPVPRAAFAIAKLLVAAGWWALCCLVVLAEGYLIGFALGLPGWSIALGGRLLSDALVAGALSYLLAPVVAWVTVAARNYLAAIGFAFGMLLLGNVVGHTGWAAWFPWSILTVRLGTAGAAVPALPLGSYFVLLLTCAVGVVGVCVQINRADNAQ